MTRRPVMLFPGQFGVARTDFGLLEGFRRLGWAVQPVDVGHFLGTRSDTLPAKAAYRLHTHFARAHYLAEIRRQLEMVRPDVVFLVKNTALDADTLQMMRGSGTKIVLFYPDRNFDHSGVDEGVFEHFDLIATTKSFQVDYLTAKLPRTTVAHVPHGYVDFVHQPVFTHISDADRDVDLLYAGNHSEHKIVYLTQLHHGIADASLRITGANWGNRLEGGPLAAFLDSQVRVGVAYAEAIQRARINVAIHAGPHANGWEDLVSTRTFEIPACGGFMLHVDNDEVREYFAVGEEIDVFTSAEECADKARFYLACPELRDRMTARAHARAVPAYSYHARAQAIDSLIRAL